jgi:hypothetical protein
MFKNTFGSSASSNGIDIQRNDLFHVQINLPPAIGGTNEWDNNVAFAIEKVSFPKREIATIPVKFLQQTNHQIGGDEDLGAISLSVRYAFSQPTFTRLEQWRWLTANPITGGVANTSAVKCDGQFWWWVPVNPTLSTSTSSAPFTVGGAYFLEGIICKGFTPAENADMTSRDGLVMADLNLHIDRYYPIDPANLTVGNAPTVIATGNY